MTEAAAPGVEAARAIERAALDYLEGLEIVNALWRSMPGHERGE